MRARSIWGAASACSSRAASSTRNTGSPCRRKCMDRSNPYFRQVELLVRVLPHVAKQGCFALKGGTAINLFVRDLPRLSVDIDLAYLPIEGRAESLRHVEEALHRLGSAIETALRGHKDSSAPRPRERSDRGIARIAGLRSRA